MAAGDAGVEMLWLPILEITRTLVAKNELHLNL